ncbi:hypothetical protein Hanom_Chr12g01102921 [Helianthus anomalus]
MKPTCCHRNAKNCKAYFGRLIARMVPVVSSFFTFSPHLLKIACMLPMVCHFVTRIVPE